MTLGLPPCTAHPCPLGSPTCSLLTSVGLSAAGFHCSSRASPDLLRGVCASAPGPHIPPLLSGQVCVQVPRRALYVDMQGTGGMQGAAKTCPQCPARVQTHKWERCGSMSNTSLCAGRILPQSNNEQINSPMTEKCEFPQLLRVGFLLKSKASVILFANQLKVKKIHSRVPVVAL